MSQRGFEVYRVILHDFDQLENHLEAAIVDRHLGSFASYAEAAHFLRCQGPIKPRLCWDGHVYPWYEVKREWVRSGGASEEGQTDEV